MQLISELPARFICNICSDAGLIHSDTSESVRLRNGRSVKNVPASMSMNSVRIYYSELIRAPARLDFVQVQLPP